MSFGHSPVCTPCRSVMQHSAECVFARKLPDRLAYALDRLWLPRPLLGRHLRTLEAAGVRRQKRSPRLLEVRRHGSARAVGGQDVKVRSLQRVVGALFAHVLALARQQVVELVRDGAVRHHLEPHNTLLTHTGTVNGDTPGRTPGARAAVWSHLRDHALISVDASKEEGHVV